MNRAEPVKFRGRPLPARPAGEEVQQL